MTGFQRPLSLMIRRNRSINRLKRPCFGVLVAVSDADAAAMRADLGDDEQEPEPGRGQGDVGEGLGIVLRLPMEQLQPDVQVVGEHGHLEMDRVGVEPFRRMRRQAGVVVGFPDQIFRCGPLVVEPDGVGDRLGQIRDEDAVDVAGRLEQRI